VALQVVNRSAGIEIDGRTSFPRWDGTPPDYDHIVCLAGEQVPAGVVTPGRECIG
jgi:hypothetical protein